MTRFMTPVQRGARPHRGRRRVMNNAHEHRDKTPPARPAKSILLVDDQVGPRMATTWFFASFGYTVDAVQSAEEALSLFDPAIHDLVLTDNSMPGMSGLEMARIIKARSPSTPVLMYSAAPPQNASCLDAVLQKPTHLLTLRDAVASLLARTTNP
jgi:CheY-like chemotaxis protein